MRTLLFVVGILCIALSGLAAEEPYRDRASLRTVAFCAGITSRMEVILRNFPPKEWDEATIEREAAPFAAAFPALIAYLTVHQEEAGVTQEEGETYLEVGLDLAGDLFKSGESEAQQALGVLAIHCARLGLAIAESDAEKIRESFDVALAKLYPLLPE